MIPAIALVPVLLAGGPLLGPNPAYPATAPEPGTKIAFIGDQGVTRNSKAVLDLIKAEGAHAVVILGDLGYDPAEMLGEARKSGPGEWAKLLDRLGPSFPVFAVAGNHDVTNEDGIGGVDWSEYKKEIEERLGAISGMHCQGELGEQYTCDFRGVRLILVSPGLLGYGKRESGDYIADQLGSDHLFSICGWHYNQHLLQTGNKDDQAGPEVYEACRKGGGIVATGHEHSYARTHLMDYLGFVKGRTPEEVEAEKGKAERAIVSKANTLLVQPGRTFVFHSGLGGRSIRDQDSFDPWWAKVWNTTTRPVSASDNPRRRYGALFCTFNIDNEEDHAECYFKDIQGIVADRFTVVVRARPAPRRPR